MDYKKALLEVQVAFYGDRDSRAYDEELSELMKLGSDKALELFVDSLKEWCDENAIKEGWDDHAGLAPKIYIKLEDFLAFAVQRLELIKQGE